MTVQPPVDHLKNLGSKSTDYASTGPSAAMLETFANPSPGSGTAASHYTVTHESEEFTSLCPKTGQPDYAEVKIIIQPGEKLVETKSLKLYLVAYRNEGMFMEAIANRIADDLNAAMDPQMLVVEMEFGSRGGVTTKVQACRDNIAVHNERRSKAMGPEMPKHIKDLLASMPPDLRAAMEKDFAEYKAMGPEQQVGHLLEMLRNGPIRR
jgi:7-cyano-7-deazaguanine reductase